MYLDSRETEVTESTLETHRARIECFVEWCLDQGIDDLSNLTGMDLFQFRSWRQRQLAPSSLESNMLTLRVFLRKCAQFDAVHPALPGKVDIPEIPDGKQSRDKMIDSEFAANILEHLEKYEYARVQHVMWLLMVEAGLRISALHSLDVDDLERLDDGGKLHLEHRPDRGTKLKNKHRSERFVYISQETLDVVEDYLEIHRPRVTDAYNREPLLATHNGRLATRTMRKHVYRWSRPCIITGECPEGVPKDAFEECDARQGPNSAYQCPASSSPHSVRRGYISAELDAGVPKELLSDRCDVTCQIIDKHYDKRDEEERMRLRKEILQNVYQDQDKSGYGRN